MVGGVTTRTSESFEPEHLYQSAGLWGRMEPQTERSAHDNGSMLRSGEPALAAGAASATGIARWGEAWHGEAQVMQREAGEPRPSTCKLTQVFEGLTGSSAWSSGKSEGRKPGHFEHRCWHEDLVDQQRWGAAVDKRSPV